MRGRAVSPSPSAPTINAPARVAASLGRCRAPVKKLMWRASAFSSEATWCTTVAGSPATRPPRRATICPRVSGPGTGSLGGRFARVERLDHPFGDVDARAGEDGVLEDDVAVLLLDDLRELLVAALVQVLAELALLPLEVAVEIAELALLGAALRLAH